MTRYPHCGSRPAPVRPGRHSVAQVSRLWPHRRDAGATHGLKAVALQRGRAGARATTGRAFTVVELLLAATITAVVATGATALISAVSYASQQTRDIRSTQTAGHYALTRLAETIRSARAIGAVGATQVVLWTTKDANGDDAVNLDEVAVIRYDTLTKQISYESLPASSNATVLSLADLTSAQFVTNQLNVPQKKTAVWAGGVESLAFVGYPSDIATRIIDVNFTIGAGSNAMAFRTAVSPRAPGDYLFVLQAQAVPLPGSTNVRRTKITQWDIPLAVAP